MDSKIEFYKIFIFIFNDLNEKLYSPDSFRAKKILFFVVKIIISWYKILPVNLN